MAKKPPEQEQPEIDPEKWDQFEKTLKRALSTPHKPHKPRKGNIKKPTKPK